MRTKIKKPATANVTGWLRKFTCARIYLRRKCFDCQAILHFYGLASLVLIAAFMLLVGGAR
jgi:hypothetical protein